MMTSVELFALRIIEHVHSCAIKFIDMLFFLQLVDSSPEVNIGTYWKIDSSIVLNLLLDGKKSMALKHYLDPMQSVI